MGSVSCELQNSTNISSGIQCWADNKKQISTTPLLSKRRLISRLLWPLYPLLKLRLFQQLVSQHLGFSCGQIILDGRAETKVGRRGNPSNFPVLGSRPHWGGWLCLRVLCAILQMIFDITSCTTRSQVQVGKQGTPQIILFPLSSFFQRHCEGTIPFLQA